MMLVEISRGHDYSMRTTVSDTQCRFLSKANEDNMTARTRAHLEMGGKTRMRPDHPGQPQSCQVYDARRFRQR